MRGDSAVKLREQRGVIGKPQLRTHRRQAVDPLQIVEGQNQSQVHKGRAILSVHDIAPRLGIGRSPVIAPWGDLLTSRFLNAGDAGRRHGP